MSYTPNPSGLREFALSPEVGDAVVAAAQRGAAWANGQDPQGGYTVRPATVTGGWKNEARAGAMLEVARYTRPGVRGRVLVRSVDVIERG